MVFGKFYKFQKLAEIKARNEEESFLLIQTSNASKKFINIDCGKYQNKYNIE